MEITEFHLGLIVKGDPMIPTNGVDEIAGTNRDLVQLPDDLHAALDTLEDLGSEWLSLQQNVNLFLQQGDDQRRVS
jgi:hypothetical protein